MTDTENAFPMDPDLFAIAIDRHDDLPYHNVDHMLDVAAYGRELIGRCHEHGVPVDEDVVYMAILFHDTAYATDTDEHIFDSKEAYSAQVARTYLSAHNLDRDFIEGVADTIMATHPEASPKTTEGKLVRAADLRGLMADYDTFHQNAVLLRDEARMLGHSMSEREWVDGTIAAIRSYLDEDIRLTPEHDTDDGLSAFHEQARENIERFEAEHWHVLTAAGAD